MRLNVDHPINRFIIAEGNDPVPEILFHVNPILSTLFISDTNDMDKPFEGIALVYQYDEQIDRQKYRYIFKGYRKY